MRDLVGKRNNILIRLLANYWILPPCSHMPCHSHEGGIYACTKFSCLLKKRGLKFSSSLNLFVSDVSSCHNWLLSDRLTE